MALFPKSIDLDDASIAELKRLYADATSDIQRIVRVTVAGSLTLTSVQHARAMIAQRLSQLQQDTQGWSQHNVTASYDHGKHDAVRQLQSFSSTIAIVAATKIATDAALNALHSEAARSLADAMATRLDGATQQMYKSSSDTLMKALNQNVRNRIAAGQDSQPVLKKSILDDLDRLDVNALIDRGGKAWSPEVYAEMLSRTSLTQARNQALSDALSSQDFDLVVVSAHGAEDACGPWEDTVLSLNGSVPGYPTVDEATGAGLFHVNCKHALNSVSPSDYPSGYFAALAVAAAVGDATAPMGTNTQGIDETDQYSDIE